MNKIASSLLLSACVVASTLSASTQANKTYFSGRTEMQHRGRLWAVSAHHPSDTKSGKIGGMFSVVPFAFESTNEGGLAKYFGAGKDTTNGSDINGTVQVVRADAGTTNALVGRDIEHVYNYGGTGDTNAPMAGTLNFKPKQDRWGLHFCYEQSLEKLGVKNVVVSIDAPFVEVKNNLQMSVTDDTVSTATDPALASGKNSVSAFFKGDVEKTTTTGGAAKNQQAKLAYAKVPGKELKASGLADVRVTLAYDFVKENDCNVRLGASVIIPTGNKPTAVNLFEPIYGNGGHVGAAGNVHGSTLMWENEKHTMSFWLSGCAEYTYLFRSREKRVMGVWDNIETNTTTGVVITTNNKLRPWGHAILGVEAGKAGIFPLANVLAHNLYITPGSHFEGVVGGTFTWKKLFVNVGYNMFYRQQEMVQLANAWANDKYGFVPYFHDASTTAAGASFNGQSVTDDTVAKHAVGGPIQDVGVTSTKLYTYTASSVTYDGKVRYNIYPQVAQTPDQGTHTVLASAGISHKLKALHVSAVVGGSYEIPITNNKALQGWSVFGKVSVGF